MDAELATGLTRELREFVASVGTRRALPVTHHFGRPGAWHSVLTDVDDPSLRTDLVERAIDGLRDADGACVWVTRGGDLETTDADRAWHAAARTGFARHGLVLPAFAVLTRTAWLDLVSGEKREWRRVRRRSTAA